tara:strand:- start:295 stop:540 length:246 start_codon:yes stop_codon:yes gene_type:complete
MFNWLKNLRNKKSAEKYNWSPWWFGAEDFDKDLIEKIKRFQRACNLWASGYCDKKTYKLALLYRLKKLRRKYKWINNPSQK